MEVLEAPITTFYAEIPPFYSIVEIANPEHYYPVPDDWWIALTDVRGSTKAIQAGRYRDVNTVAAASIASMLNAVKGADIPYVFGGDGATMLVPPEYKDDAAAALAASCDLSRDLFQMELRAAIIPAKVVLDAGYTLRVAKLWIGDNFQQAIFDGGGLGHAETLLKDTEIGPEYSVDGKVEPQGNFYGFECRWNEIRSTHEETIALIVMAMEEDEAARTHTYRDTLQKLEEIYGDRATRHPIALRNLRLAFSLEHMKTESRVRHQTVSLRRRLKMLEGSIKAWIAMQLGIGQWPEYKRFLTEATDHEKFDDTLRMIISGTVDQRRELDRYLTTQHRAGRLVYGIKTSNHALVTCIVYDYFGKQVHFVDGADGGYALAAKQMKAQLAAFAQE